MVTTKKIQENLTKSLLSPIILDLLNGQPMCGYQIIKNNSRNLRSQIWC